MGQITKTCPVCEKSFKTRWKRVQTCSKPCGHSLRGQKRAAAFEQDRASGKLKGRYMDAAGYWRILVAVGRWRLEHRYVMEQILGRKLGKRERVHHKNGNRGDNRPDNLELWKLKKDCPGVRAADYHCHGCRCYESMEFQDGLGI